MLPTSPDLSRQAGWLETSTSSSSPQPASLGVWFQQPASALWPQKHILLAAIPSSRLPAMSGSYACLLFFIFFAMIR